MVQVGRLAPERWREYKELRLEALEADPTAFGSSAEDEAQLSDAEWAKRAQNVLIAFSGGEPIGMIGFLLSHRSKTNHLADIFSV